MIYNVDAEEKVLGYFFNPYIEKEKKLIKLQVLTTEHFYIDQHQVIYKAIKLFEVFDKIVLWDKIQTSKMDKNLSFGLEFADLDNLDEIITENEAESYTEILVDVHQKRMLHDLGKKIQDAMDQGKDQFKIALETQSLLSNLSSKHKVESNKEILDRVLTEESGDVLSTGYRFVDSFIGGYSRGMIITIAGDSGHLKTTLALDKAFRMAERNPDITIGVFSKEMLETDIMKKQIARICKIPINKIYSQDYDVDEVKSKMNEVEAWKNDRVRIINPASFSGVADIAKIQMTYRFDVWFLDFIQLLEFAKSASTASDYNIQIGQNMRNLQSLAITTKSVGVVLSQVKKGIELRKVKRPTISDIEWSGLIKQLSSYIFFSYYPGKYYGFDAIPKDYYYLIGEKTRFAENFTYPIKVKPELGLFEELEDIKQRRIRADAVKQLFHEGPLLFSGVKGEITNY